MAVLFGQRAVVDRRYYAWCFPSTAGHAITGPRVAHAGWTQELQALECLVVHTDNVIVEYIIREYRAGDAGGLRACMVELQDFERTIDPRVRPGDAMADAYCEQMHAHCREAVGRVFVAEHNGSVVGFVAVVAHEPFTSLDDPPGTYALITDLAVLSSNRNQGIGRRLVEQAEIFARTAGATELRIGVLTQNTGARRLYLDAAFVPHLEVLTKPL